MNEIFQKDTNEFWTGLNKQKDEVWSWFGVVGESATQCKPKIFEL